jgi:hypothetical protein
MPPPALTLARPLLRTIREVAVIRTMGGLIALLSVSGVAAAGPQSFGYALVVAGALLGALALLFGSCLVVGDVEARRRLEPDVTRGALRRPGVWAGESAPPSLEAPVASRRQAA